MKARFDNVLAQLSEEQQAQVFEWLQTLGYTETIRKIALPVPEGFGLTTYRASLHRFYVRYSLQSRADDSALADQIKSDQSSRLALRGGTDAAVQHSAFQLATSPHGIAEFAQLSRWVLKQQNHDQKQEYLEIARRHLELSEKRLSLDREKFEFNAARHALDHHGELGEILQNPEGDNEDKINAARAILFNRPISELPK